MKRSLFDISREMQALDEMLTDMDGEITDEVQEAFIDNWLAEIGEERDQKLDNYGLLIAELEARSESRFTEAKRIAALAQQDRKAADKLRERLRIFFITHNLGKIQTLHFKKIGLVNNGGKRTILFNCDPEELPEEYQKKQVVIKPDSDKIRQDLENGKELPFAELAERGNRIDIR